jgi:hypothetical protein
MYIIYIKSPFPVTKLSKFKFFNINPTTSIQSPYNSILRSYLRLSLYHAITKYSSMFVHFPNVNYISLSYFICVHALSNCDLYESNILHMCPYIVQLWSIWVQYISSMPMHCPIVIYMSPIYFICVHTLSNCDLYESNILHMCPYIVQLWSIWVQYISSMPMHYSNVIYMSFVYFICVHALSNILHLCSCTTQMWFIWVQFTSSMSMQFPTLFHRSPIYFICVLALPKCDLYESNILHSCPCASNIWSIGV